MEQLLRSLKFGDLARWDGARITALRVTLIAVLA
jgi:hypothetical protein